MSLKSPRLSCMVLGGGVTALGVIRSLSRAGIHCNYSSTRSDIAAWSRLFKRKQNWPSQSLCSSSLADWLRSTGFEHGVLMPCSDPWVQSVAGLDPSLRVLFRTWTPHVSVVETLIDKNRFRGVLEQLDLPHPRTFSLTPNSDGTDIPSEVFSSAFLKPCDSSSFLAEYGVKGIFVTSPQELNEKNASAAAKGLSLVLQEYVPGSATNHFFVDGFRSKNQQITRFLARRRLRMFPPDFGNSTDMVSIPLREVAPAIATIEKIFEHLEYHGIFSAEFKYDDRDGQFKILEINCRPWWYVDFADRCGLHTCRDACYDALDLPIPGSKPYRVGKRGTYPSQDWEAYRANGGLDITSFIAMLFNWFRSYQPIFSWSDPTPAFVNFARLFSAAIKRRVQRMIGASFN